MTTKKIRILSFVLVTALFFAGNVAKATDFPHRRLGGRQRRLSSGSGKGKGGASTDAIGTRATFCGELMARAAVGGKGGKGSSRRLSSGKGATSMTSSSSQDDIDCDAYCACMCEASNWVNAHQTSSTGKGKGGGSRKLSGKGGKGKGYSNLGVQSVRVNTCEPCRACGEITAVIQQSQPEPAQPAPIEQQPQESTIIEQPQEPDTILNLAETGTTSGPTPGPTPTPRLVVPLEQPQTCVESHVGYGGNSTYGSLYGWIYKVTEDSKLNCDDDTWDIGYEDDGSFDELLLLRGGERTETWAESCPVNYDVQAGDFLVFYSDNSHEYAGFKLCLDNPNGLVPAPVEEGIILSGGDDGCFVSHPGWDGVTNYAAVSPFYGYSLKIEGDGVMTAESFNTRDPYHKMRLYRGNTQLAMWAGVEDGLNPLYQGGPSNQEVRAGDIVTWFVDDASIRSENTGFKVCIDSTR